MDAEDGLNKGRRRSSEDLVAGTDDYVSFWPGP